MDGSIVFARWRQCVLLLVNTCFLGPIQVHVQNSISIGSTIFAQLTAGSPYTLQWAAHCPPKIAPSHRVSGPQSNTWSLRPTRVQNPNGISIDSAIFAELTNVTDRPTDRQTMLLLLLQQAAGSRPTMRRPNNINAMSHRQIKVHSVHGKSNKKASIRWQDSAPPISGY